MQHAARPAGPFTPRLPAFYFGGDYNPEQWTPALGYEGEAVWQEDIRLMRLAGVNVATVGVFSWVSLQPDEHDLHLRLARSGDGPAARERDPRLPGHRHRRPARLALRRLPRCPAGGRAGAPPSPGAAAELLPDQPGLPAARAGMARRLAERYKEHPALLLWHVSNEYGP